MIYVSFYSSGYWDVSLRQVFFIYLCIEYMIFRHYSKWVPPFGHSRIKGCLGPPRDFSHPATSFIVVLCQGIHHVPLLHTTETHNGASVTLTYFLYCWTLWIVKYSRFCYNIPILSDNCIQDIYRCLKIFLKKNRLQANTNMCNARFCEIYIVM